MTDTVVAEGQVKFREGKKWKTRWVVLRKPSPVADCLSLLVYKEKKKGKEKASSHKERLNVMLEGICGVEPGPGYDGVSYTLSILCLARTLVLGFTSRDALLAWDARVCYSLGEVHRFSVNVEPGTKLESGPACLHLCNNLLVLTRGLPPVITGHWKLSALRRYGAVPNGFVFEGGTRCGYWAGVFFLSCSEGEQISFLFDCIVRGIAPSRAVHGLRPSLPDPSADPASAEERISQEASELEKRLSMLSQCSLASSTASTYSSSTSVAGDDHSSISSSSSSQSDTSYGTRHSFWVEPLSRSHLSSETASSSCTPKALTGSDDRLYAALMAGSGTRPSSAQLQTRGLHDSGRQSSLDSGIGIGIATGSQSSYSGSFSSCTESLEMASQEGAEEFGSEARLPSPPLPPPHGPPPTSSPPPFPFQSVFNSEHSSAATTTSSCTSKSNSCASRRHSEEYQIPSLLKLWYDTPRSLLQTLSLSDPSAQAGLPELGRSSRCREEGGRNQDGGRRAQRQGKIQRSHSWDSERALPVDIEGRSTPRPLLTPGDLVCEKTQYCHGVNYITPEQWRSARNGGLTQITTSPTGLSPSEDTQDRPVCVREKHVVFGEAGNKFCSAEKRLLPSGPPSAPPPLPATPSTYKPTPACMFQSPHEAPQSVTGLRSDSTVNYVNIPISALPAKTNSELLYMELDLREPSSARVSSPHSAVREGSSTYAKLDITAMAQRVGAEHVQGREGRLSQLENRWEGSPN
ncbi:protein Dok-7 isoform X2 [Mastacembelus armatus]|uniref:protein Dok-7 isoform X2 n=1 Tax=Mastacembelus armatus TaxID=205130 RepID=UPI000E463284|nr:protein Dok-7-like isoform X2 [Mastacembelus armatus]